jgi:hypothetical protein
MRIKFLGEWYDIQCFNITKNDGTAFITKDYENSIEDIEINGRHLAHLNNEVNKTEAVEPQDNKPTKKKQERLKVGDIVMTVNNDGEIFRGCIKEVHDSGTVCVSNEDGIHEIDGVPFRELVDDSADADHTYSAWRIATMQAEYWKGKAQRPSDSKHSKMIDWEQRRWDLACRLSIRYHGKERRDAEEIIHFVDVLIDEYRKEVKL